MDVWEDLYQQLNETDILKQQMYIVHNSFIFYRENKFDFTIDELDVIFVEFILDYNKLFYNIQIKYNENDYPLFYKIFKLFTEYELDTFGYCFSDIENLTMNKLIKQINNAKNAKNDKHTKQILTFLLELKKLIPDLTTKCFTMILSIKRQLKLIKEYNHKIFNLYSRIIPDDFIGKSRILIYENLLYTHVFLESYN